MTSPTLVCCPGGNTRSGASRARGWASARNTSTRLTMPASLPSWLTTGTRLISCAAMMRSASAMAASSVVVITGLTITSATVCPQQRRVSSSRPNSDAVSADCTLASGRPSRASTSPSVRMPTIRCASSTTGRLRYACPISISTASAIGVSGITVRTSRLIRSRTGAAARSARNPRWL